MEAGYWERHWSGFRKGTTRIALKWDGGAAEAVLYDEGVPRTTAALLGRLPLSVGVIHVAWSGDMVMTGQPIDLGVHEAENDVRLPQPGELGWDPKIDEITFTYGVAECHAPTGSWSISVFGRIDKGLAEFAQFARSTRFEGVKQLTLTRIPNEGKSEDKVMP